MLLTNLSRHPVVSVWKVVSGSKQESLPKYLLRYLLKYLPALLIILLTIVKLVAQSPTTDTLDKRQIYVEGNFWTATQSHRNGGEQVYGGRLAYGLRHHLEIGINGSLSDPNDPEFPPEIQPSVKWKFYENKKHGLAAAVGVTAFIPVARRRGTDTFVMIYGNVSKTLDAFKGARFTIGFYQLLVHSRIGSRRGLNFNYEQPLNRKLSLAVQWVTGNNRFGYATPGLNITPTKNSSLFLGYSIGNYRYDNHGPYLSYGFYF